MKCYATDVMSNPRSRVKLLVNNLRYAIFFLCEKNLMRIVNEKFNLQFPQKKRMDLK